MAVWRPLGEVVDEIAPATAPADLPSPAPLPTGTPWESRDQVGFFVGLFETVRTFLLEPKATFEAMRPNGGLGAPLFFFFIMSLLGLLAGVAYQVLAQTIQGTGASDGQPLALIFRSGFFTGLTIIVTPVFLIAGVFFTSGLLHLALMLVGGANRPFEATFRVVCYAGGATAVLQLLPLCGGIAASVYNLVLLVIGISTVQAISRHELSRLFSCLPLFVAEFLFSPWQDRWPTWAALIPSCSNKSRRRWSNLTLPLGESSPAPPAAASRPRAKHPLRLCLGRTLCLSCPRFPLVGRRVVLPLERTDHSALSRVWWNESLPRDDAGGMGSGASRQPRGRFFGGRPRPAQ